MQALMHNMPHRTWKWSALLLAAILWTSTAHGDSDDLAFYTEEKNTPTQRILLVGDSWAALMGRDNIMSSVFSVNGVPGVLERGLFTVIPGSTAASWNTQQRKNTLTNELNAAPSLRYVQIHMGGNDLLAGPAAGGYHTSLTPGQVEAVVTTVRDNVHGVISHILSVRPDIQILLVGYDYPNFAESLSSFNNCTNIHNTMGNPTTRQYNDVLIALEVEFRLLDVLEDQVIFVSPRGLMQRHFGIPTAGIPPGGSLPGNPNYPSPAIAMNMEAGTDCIHLGYEGYLQVGQLLFDSYYKERFRLQGMMLY